MGWKDRTITVAFRLDRELVERLRRATVRLQKEHASVSMAKLVSYGIEKVITEVEARYGPLADEPVVLPKGRREVPK